MMKVATSGRAVAFSALLVLSVSLFLSGCSAVAPSFAGAWVAHPPDGATLTIRSNDTYTGHDCNVLTGKGTVSADTFEFGPIRSTDYICPAPAAGVTLWLGGAGTAKLSGNTLTIYDTGGTKIGTLHRKK